ncbi:hypothetical protein [Bacillus dakarensis]|uniref:hypothetical protein n=1 Tax=Robertmurraya dakarensis TaxID=1926278 RepID=UPI0009811647|nr:hypothetical protein [Bacillus dakarensis]
MLDKKLTFKTANQALKEIIIPELEDGVAKEQAIALISVLKNLDMWTVENISPKEQLIAKIQENLEEQFQKLEQDSGQFSSLDWKGSLEKSYKNTEGLVDVTEKWKVLNDIQCQLIQQLYKENDRNPEIQESYITPLREKVREQLNIEMSLVR